MIEIISSGLSSLSAAVSVVQGLKAASTEASVLETKLDLMGKLMTAQQALMLGQQALTTADGRVSELEQEIARLKDWSAERENYELVAIDRGAVAYTQKAGVEPAEPVHWLCAECFNNAKKSVLQPQGQGKTTDQVLWSCAAKHTFSVQFRIRPR